MKISVDRANYPTSVFANNVNVDVIESLVGILRKVMPLTLSIAWLLR